MAFSYHAPQHPFDLPIVEPHLSTTAAADASSSSCFIHAIAADAAAAAFPYSPSDAHLLANCSKRKRKSGDEESLVSGEDYKDGGDASARQKRAKKKANADDETKKDSSCKASSDPTGGGYIHVRARRGQATDSHSLAERVRREKISERMKMLQGLVPGCEKVTGKALMLDEIINYVQSLQNQVEFLSMRIASLSPMLYDFNVDLEDRINQHHHHQKMIRSNMPQTILPSLEQANKAFEHGEANYQVMESSPVQVLQGPTAISQVDGQRVGFLDQLGFINMCSFQ